MKIVLDTNILLQSLGHSSRFRTIWKAFLDEVFDLHVTASILFEYEEQLTQKTSEQVALNVSRCLLKLLMYILPLYIMNGMRYLLIMMIINFLMPLSQVMSII